MMAFFIMSTNIWKHSLYTGFTACVIVFCLLVFPFFGKKNEPFTAKLHSGLSARLQKNSSFLIGLLNGLMPCGPLQSMQIYALSTGSALQGALSMLSFSLGTVPLLLGFGFFSGTLNRQHRRVMLSVSALVIFVMGLNMMGNGMALMGLSVPTQIALTAPDAEIVPEKAAAPEPQNDIQKLRTEIDYGRYPAIQVKAGIPVEWTIVVPEGKLTGCNGELIIPALDLDLALHEGENILGFTVDEPGIIPYSCWMGMIRSTIEVFE